MTTIFLIAIVITVTVAIICGAIFRRRSRNVQSTKSVKHTTKDPDSLAPQKITDDQKGLPTVTTDLLKNIPEVSEPGVNPILS